MSARRSSSALLLAALVGMYGCTDSSPPSVGGLVEAPNGAIAAAEPPSVFARLSAALFAQAWALTGLDPVGKGVDVTFERIDGEGNVTRTLITVDTFADGTYSIDLASNEEPGSSLTFSVGSGGTLMRAFFYANGVDINPASEATVRLLLDSDFPLANFSAADLQNIQTKVDVATADVAAGNSIAVANARAEEAAAEDPEVIEAIAQGGGE